MQQNQVEFTVHIKSESAQKYRNNQQQHSIRSVPKTQSIVSVPHLAPYQYPRTLLYFYLCKNVTNTNLVDRAQIAPIVTMYVAQSIPAASNAYGKGAFLSMRK